MEIQGAAQRPSLAREGRPEGIGASSGLASVMMVQTSKQRQCDDVALLWRFNGPWLRAILVQSSVGAVAMIILEVIGQYPV